MNKLKLITVLIVLVALSASLGLAQPSGYWDDGYNSYSPFDNMETAKDVPAGFVNEPGSQLIYLLDTGINAEELYGDDVNFTSNSVLQYGNTAPCTPELRQPDQHQSEPRGNGSFPLLQLRLC